jgi:hypothetical protein
VFTVTLWQTFGATQAVVDCDGSQRRRQVEPPSPGTHARSTSQLMTPEHVAPSCAPAFEGKHAPVMPFTPLAPMPHRLLFAQPVVAAVKSQVARQNPLTQTIALPHWPEDGQR